MTVISFNEVNRKRQRTLALFRQFYKQRKRFHFPDRKNIDMRERLYLPKRYGVIDNAKPLRAAIAVYPTLCMQAAHEGGDWVHLSLENLAKMAGISIPTARKGVDNLTQWVGVKVKKHRGKEQIVSTFPLLEIRRGRRNAYKVGYVKRELVKEWRGNYFAFHTCIIESGVWASLSLLAKAVYFHMRICAEQDFDTYFATEGDLPFSPQDYQQYYKQRKWDSFYGTPAYLAKQIGCNYDLLRTDTLKQLSSYGLAEQMGGMFKVYLRPKTLKPPSSCGSQGEWGREIKQS